LLNGLLLGIPSPCFGNEILDVRYSLAPALEFLIESSPNLRTGIRSRPLRMKCSELHVGKFAVVKSEMF
jgi:hypothetical protein